MRVCVTAEGGRVRTDELQGAYSHPVQEWNNSVLQVAADPTQISKGTHSYVVKFSSCIGSCKEMSEMK